MSLNEQITIVALWRKSLGLKTYCPRHQVISSTSAFSTLQINSYTNVSVWCLGQYLLTFPSLSLVVQWNGWGVLFPSCLRLAILPRLPDIYIDAALVALV